jgi:hypothetical protein
MGSVTNEVWGSTSSGARQKEAKTERGRTTSNHRGNQTPLGGGSEGTGEMNLAR